MVLSLQFQKQMTKLAKETADIPMIQESSYVKIRDEDNVHHFLQYHGYY
jgi:hypothetical protein